MKVTARRTWPLLCLLTATSFGQPTRMITEFAARDVQSVSIDRLGNFYTVSSDNRIRKYDTEGRFMNEFKNTAGWTVTLLEPWNPLRVFIYSRDKQKIILLDHDMQILQTIGIDSSLAVESSLAAPSVNNYWLLDKTDYSLKKVESRTAEVLSEINVKPKNSKQSEFSFVREYQNQIFLLDPTSGIYIFSYVGKPIRFFPATGVTYIGFLGQELYYLDQQALHFYDLYTEDLRQQPVSPSARIVLVTDERMIIVNEKGVQVWAYKP